jgi:hypothetical protein
VVVFVVCDAVEVDELSVGADVLETDVKLVLVEAEAGMMASPIIPHLYSSSPQATARFDCEVPMVWYSTSIPLLPPPLQVPAAC